ncbi:MAG: BACON domain-containing protein, partial [Muribaculaceae bacterium]|nr:BACON domain-containing protein [Muribaculaceae bacterium]
YEVTSFATVMGVTYESPAVEFRIDGDLELSEQSLTFSETGGRANVDVTLPSDSWDWEIASGAKWCKVTRLDDDTFNVETTTSKEKRETFVTVTATSPRGDKQVKTITVTQMVIGDFAFFEGLLRMKQDVKYPSKPEYNFTKENDIESVLCVMRMGGTTNLSFVLPLSGIIFSNWTLSTTPPSGSMLIDGVKVIRFNCASSATQISIDGATMGPDNTTTEFSVKIDFAALQVKILESQHDSGIGNPGMAGSTEYKSHSTLSGTLNYTDKYTEKYN